MNMNKRQQAGDLPDPGLPGRRMASSRAIEPGVAQGLARVDQEGGDHDVDEIRAMM
jgi:hypothetical protein